MTTTQQQEIDKFSALSSQWWDRDGPLKTLHDINPTRMDYIKQFCEITGKRVLDVGCGGGILSEALACEGASVTAIDLAEPSVAVAIAHAAAKNVAIDYRVQPIETLDEPPFDVITCLEMLEHVPDFDAIIKACSARLADGGTLILSTINRTPKAYAMAIIGAEYLLRLLPVQTHDYKKFIKPSELCRSARMNDLQLLDLRGLDYKPLVRSSNLADSLDVNYLAVFKKGATL